MPLIISPSGASNLRTTDSTGFNLDLNAIVLGRVQGVLGHKRAWNA